MTLAYNIIEVLDRITPVLNEHILWYDDLMSKLLFPEDVQDEGVSRLAAYHAWYHQARSVEYLTKSRLDQIQAAYEALQAYVTQLYNETRKTGRMPDKASLQKLSALHLDFCMLMRDCEKKAILEEGGLDSLTGLGSWTQLLKDLKTEQERYDRGGRSFTVALVRIDQYEEIIREYSVKEAREYLKLVSSLIRKSVRNYDSAYRTPEDRFVLIIRQADMSGGFSALERLKEYLEENNVNLKLAGRRELLTMSCCVAEPVPEQNPRELLEELVEDLSVMENATGAVLEFYETSPLQKFIGST